VSYAPDGQVWAEWIGWALREAGFLVALRAWDEVPGSNAVSWLNRVVRRVRCTLAVVTDGYLDAASSAEWEPAFAADPGGRERRLLVARTSDRPVPGLLGRIAPLDLFGRGELDARGALLAAVRGERARPEVPPGFPGRRPLFPPELPAVWNLPAAPARFVGRSGALAALEAAVARSPLVTVTGMAGIGKTALAMEYARQHRSEWDAVWLVPGGHPELVGDRVRELGAAVGLPAETEPAAVVAGLSRADGRWLLVLDGADDRAGVPDWLLAAVGGQGRLVVTSRDPGWDLDGPVVGLGPMERAESVALLTDRIPAVEERTAAGIAARLGDHPLALDQAAHRMIVSRTPAEVYLAVLAERPAALLGQGEVPGRPGVTAASLWAEPIGRLAAEAPEADRLLRVVAQADAAPLPVAVLTADPEAAGRAGLDAAVVGDPLALADTIGLLERHGLAHRDGDTLALHPLIRAAVQADTGPEQAAEVVAGLAGMLRASLPDTLEGNPAALPRWRALLPHTLTVLTHPDPDASPATDGEADAEAGDGAASDGAAADVAWLAERAATYLADHGKTAHAVDLAERAVPLRERLHGADHPDTLASRNVLAGVLLADGRIREAGRLAASTLTDRARVLGEDHPATLTSRETLARTYLAAGHPDVAGYLFHTTLADRERVLDSEHPDTLTSRHHLANAYGAANRGDEAIRLFRETLTDRARILGDDHPATYDTRHALAVAYRRTGALTDAAPLFEDALTGRKNVLGDDHPATLETRHELAVTHRRQGLPEDAARELDIVRESRKEVLGSDHRATLDTVHELARAHLDAGEPDKAMPLLKRALESRKHLLGADHDDTTNTRERLVDAHLALGQPREAIRHLETALNRHTRVLNPDHPRAIALRAVLAGTYRGTGQTEAALPHYEQQLTSHRHAHGDGDPRTLHAADDLAGIYRATARLPQAITLTERVLAIRDYLHDNQQLDPAELHTTRATLADTYRLARRPDDAARLYQRVLDDTLREHGPFHPDTTHARRSLAETIDETRAERTRPAEPLTTPEQPPYRQTP
jgi:tetratricopeptide (TPR) repeat protein